MSAVLFAMGAWALIVLALLALNYLANLIERPHGADDE